MKCSTSARNAGLSWRSSSAGMAGWDVTSSCLRDPRHPRLSNTEMTKPLVLLSILAVLGVGVVVALKLNAGTFTETVQNGKRIINVGPRDSLQAALDAANYGDTIVVQAGVTLTGGFVLPKKSGTGEIVIQSSRISELPEGKRVNKSQSALFAKLQTTNAAPIITTAPGAHH